MVSPQKRWKARKFRRSVKGKSRQIAVREKPSKRSCGYCGKALHGVPHGKTKAGVSKLSKTHRKPSAPLAGVLCGQCRALAVEETAMVRHGLKSIDDVGLRMKNFVEQLAKKVE
jgi:ribosomal protein L34E